MSRMKLSSDGVNRLYLLLFFSVGSLAAQLSLSGPAILHEDRFDPACVFLLPSAASLFLATSVAGVIFLPLVSLVFGSACGITATELVADFPAGAGGALYHFLILFLSVSVFFCVAVRGMQFSSALCACLERRSDIGGLKIKAFFPMAATVFLLGAAIYFL